MMTIMKMYPQKKQKRSKRNARERWQDPIQRFMPDPGITLEQVKQKLAESGEDEGALKLNDEALWLLVLECWRSAKGLLHDSEVPPHFLLEAVLIRYYNHPNPDF